MESEHPLTVLQIIPDLEVGGAERTTVDIAAALQAAGARALVASAGGRLVAEVEASGARHVTMAAGAKDPARMLANAAAIARLVHREAIDIVHARSRAPAWAALVAARRTGVHFVTTYHGAYNQPNRLKALYNSVMARGDRVIANSAYTARLIAARHPWGADRIVTIPRGVDFAAFTAPDVAQRAAALRARWGVAADEMLVLQLARLTRWKGQRVLIEALARLATGAGAPLRWRAVLAGDAQGREGYREALLAAIAAAGLDDRVRLTGPCDDPAAAMTAADLVVVPSIEPEAFGRAAVEAQAAKKPVIVSDLGAVPETVLAPPETDEHTRTGWRVPSGDPQALADAIAVTLALDAAARAAIGARAREHVTSQFSVGTMQAATLSLYRELSGHRDFGYS